MYLVYFLDLFFFFLYNDNNIKFYFYSGAVFYLFLNLYIYYYIDAILLSVLSLHTVHIFLDIKIHFNFHR